MGRPQQVSDERILSVMKQRALVDGPRARLEDVADELGVTVPALLKRFGTREALMLAALKPTSNPEWIAHARQGPDRRDLETQLADLFGRMLAFLAEVVPCLITLRESGIPKEKFMSEKQPLAGLAALERWLEQGKAQGLVTAGELETAAMAMLGALQGRVFVAHLQKKPISLSRQQAYVQDLARLFTRALAPGE